MSKSKQPKKVRTDLRKNRAQRARDSDMTRQWNEDQFENDETARTERIGRDETTRRRTIVVSETGDAAFPAIDIDLSICLPGRVLSAGGLASIVLADDGRRFSCATRRLLKTISTSQRHVVAAGDHVMFRPVGDAEGMIERIEPRYSTICRTSRGRQHVMVANIDQLVIVTSAAEPVIKPNLIDRMLVAAEKGNIEPLICINKIDLVDAADLQPLIGVYGQLGYRVLLASATTGQSVNQLREAMRGRASVVAGQSGVGKSSLLNEVEPGLGLLTRPVSATSQKGRHTTTAAQLWPLSFGGFVVDTPGIRQFQLWDVSSDEMAGFYPELRPLESACQFPDCTHTHEADCAIKDGVADGIVDARRYESYCHLRLDETE